jgi:hypothetical protein
VIVSELISLLQDCADDQEVLIAHQPSWPLQHHVYGVWDASVDEQPCSDHERVDCEDCGPAEPNPFVYVVADDGHPDEGPYAPRSAWDAAVTA